MKARFLFPLTALALLTFTARAEIEIIQVGGGDHIERAQGQIESNVVWLNRILPQISSRLTNFFGSGSSPEKDVAYWSPDAEPTEIEPLTRVFEGVKEGQLVYRHNRLERVDGPTSKAALTKALTQNMSDVRPNGEVLFIYNGHGGLSYNQRIGLSWPDPRRNYLRLWGRERMTIAEVDAIFDQAPSDATIRFIFPQCYSGSFARLIYETPESDRPAQQNRCGFLSQSAWAESEGCSLNINKDTFRDYTTYYFAPLYGQTRTDEPLPGNPDLDGDGQLSYREGHLYTLRYGESKDLSRSTSEAFLEDWEPWYLRWDTIAENKDSLYWDLALAVAERHNLSLDGRDLRKHRQRLRTELSQIQSERKSLEEKIKASQRALQDRVKLRWPELFHPYTEAYRRLLDAELAVITAFVTADPGFVKVSTNQDRLIEIEQEELAAERRLAQVEKVIRFKKLARLEAQFELFASSEDRLFLERLRGCENAVLAPFTHRQLPVSLLRRISAPQLLGESDLQDASRKILSRSFPHKK